MKNDRVDMSERRRWNGSREADAAYDASYPDANKGKGKGRGASKSASKAEAGASKPQQTDNKEKGGAANSVKTALRRLFSFTRKKSES
jgi:hypothetical protein